MKNDYDKQQKDELIKQRHNLKCINKECDYFNIELSNNCDLFNHYEMIYCENKKLCRKDI